jgi:hypothetical protein
VLFQVGGRQFTFTPDTADSGGVIVEVTLPGDPNPPNAKQVFIWQSELWAILNDGTSIPLFYDGTLLTLRRAYTNPPQIYTTAQDFIVPASGAAVSVFLTGPYTSGSNFGLLIGNEAVFATNNAFTASPSTNPVVTLLNITDTPGKVHQGGSNVTFDPQFIGYVIGDTITESGGKAGIQETISALQGDVLGALLGAPGPIVYTINANLCKIFPPNLFASLGITLPEFKYSFQTENAKTASSYVQGVPYFNPKNNPSRVVGTTLASSLGQFTAPAIGSPVTLSLTKPFIGAVGQIVFVGGGNSAYYVQSTSNEYPSEITAIWAGTGSVTEGSTIQAGTPVYPNLPGNELPPGGPGAYSGGRNWVALPDGTSFIASDLVGDPSGSGQYNLRDAVLKVTENTALVGGGVFTVPSSGEQIASMNPTAQLNAALGQGPLSIGTSSTVFSCNAPSDRTTWASLTYPILTESQLGGGFVSYYGTGSVNGDLRGRAVDGIRSNVMAQRQFDDTRGNTPISYEVSPTLNADNPALIYRCSRVFFDNRELYTASPVQGPCGVYFQNIIALNLDAISSLRGDAPPIYDGLWQNLNVLQLVTGIFNGTQRCFAFVYNANANGIEIWEILPSQTSTTTTVTSLIDLPPFKFGENNPKDRTFKSLDDLDLGIYNLTGPTTVQVLWRPDDQPTWTPWYSMLLCSASDNYAPYYVAAGCGQPPTTPDAQGNALRSGYTFQVRLVITGPSWTLKQVRCYAHTVPTAKAAVRAPANPPT